MLGRRTNQFSFADVDEWWRKIPSASRWAQIRAWSQSHWQDEVFALWYADTGRPSIPPSYMVTLLLLQLVYGWSDRQAVENGLFDDRVKFALGVSRTPEITCDHSTLCKFRAQALAQGAGRQLLQQTLTEASAAGLLGDEGDLIDSFMIAGAAARQGTLMLIARAIGRVLVEAEEVGLVAPALRRADYRSRRKPAIEWGSETARHELLQELVVDAGTLVAWGQQAGQPESLRQAAELLAVVAAQDITRDEDGTAHIAQQVAPDRVISVVDPEMRHGRKSSSQKFDGYKAHVTAQQGGNGKPRLVTGLTVTPGNTPDGDGAVAALAERKALTGHWPEELMGDTAYGGIQTRAVIAQQAPAVTLTAPVPPGSARAGQFPKAAFAIDLEAQTVTCPGGTVVSFRQRQRHTFANHRQTVIFPLVACAACALRAQCVSGTGARRITIHPAEAQIQAERARQAAPSWQRHYRRRSEIEHVIRGLTRLRDRATHFYGQRKTEMQLIWQAIGYNIHELARFPVPRPEPV